MCGKKRFFTGWGENTVIKKAEVPDSVIGAYCEIKEGTKVKESRIRPFVYLPERVTVNGDIKRFVRIEGNEKKDLLSYLPEEEAFYFYMEKEKDDRIAIVDTGSVARSLEEFLEILTRIDYESIEHQFSGDVNDFCE